MWINNSRPKKKKREERKKRKKFKTVLESEQASTDGMLLFYRDGKGYHKGEMICICLKSLLEFRVYLIIKPAECQDYRLWEDGSIRSECSADLSGKEQ